MKQDASSPRLINTSSEAFQVAVSIHQAGQLQDALVAYQALLEDYPKDHRIISNIGTIFLQMGDLGPGVATLESSLAIYHDQPHALNSLGNAMTVIGRLERALDYYEEAHALAPHLLEACVNQANVLNHLGRLNEGLVCINAALDGSGDRPEWHLLKAVILFGLQSYEESLRCVDESLERRSDFPEAHVHRGGVLATLGRLSEALKSYDIAERLNPCSADIQKRRAELLQAMSRPEDAVIAGSRAIELEPHNHLMHIAHGNVLYLSKAYEAAQQAFSVAIKLDPAAGEAYKGRAKTFSALKIHLRAIEDFGMALKLTPTDIQTYIDRAFAFQETGAFRRALLDFQHAFNEDPSKEECLMPILINGLRSLEWGDRSEILCSIRRRIEQGSAPDCGPSFLLAALDDPALHRQTADNYLSGFFGAQDTRRFWPRFEPSQKIIVGYFSSDYREHPVSFNLLPVIKAHDRGRFKIIGFDFSPPTSDHQPHDISKAFDAVYDIRNASDSEAAALARSLGVNIAVDLNGHTLNARPGIFKEGAAPIQVNYLGYAGTMGGSYHDAIIADCRVIPGALAHHYSEKVFHLPHFFMPYDFHGADIDRRWPRSRYGLPDHQFVFCSFNEFYKISESIFNAWMHVLSSTNDSVLYLAIRGDITASDLQEKVERMGVNPTRIIIADRIASFEEHLSRLSLCDLMLDTFPYNSHTTACDAIMAGLPLIAMRGQSFASRVSSSLLEHIGVPDLVANSVAEYRTKAMELAKNPDYYRAVRERVAAGRNNLPSDKVYTQNLEALFSDMVRGREQKRGRFQVP